ncbi:hypothetical protein OG21DRAFT_507727 [Imleria badia]|nr:hypothetical protein OG21DRAFT_507727 [Imleria badia]
MFFGVLLVQYLLQLEQLVLGFNQYGRFLSRYCKEGNICMKLAPDSVNRPLLEMVALGGCHCWQTKPDAVISFEELGVCRNFMPGHNPDAFLMEWENPQSCTVRVCDLILSRGPT